MIIGTCFEGDDDETLKMYQHACYYDLIARWVNLAGKRRLQYGRLPEWEEITTHWEDFREAGHFDHRCIQAHHDLIAERFRMIQKKPDLYFWNTLGKNGWISFFDREAAKLIEDPELLRLFMTAVTYTNTTTGYDAEDALLNKIREKYGMNTHAACRD